MAIAPTAAVGTLRLRLLPAPGAADTPALRLRAARELAGAELAPAGLAPAAVLLVRRMADPLPGGFGGGGGRPRDDWQRAVRDELAAAARRAERPDARGRLPAGAAAVLFADDSELLACLLADRARGEHAGRWWWRLLLPRLAVSRGAAVDGSDPAPLLAACPRELPAAFAHLARWGEAGPVAASLGAAGARRALAALVHEHDLSPALLPEGAGGAFESRAAGDGSPPASAEPWREWLAPAAAAAATAPEARALAGIALGLVHAPRRVRSTAFAAAARRWWQAAAAGGDRFRQPSPGSGEDPRQVPARSVEARRKPEALDARAAAEPAGHATSGGDLPVPAVDGRRPPGAAGPAAAGTPPAFPRKRPGAGGEARADSGDALPPWPQVPAATAPAPAHELPPSGLPSFPGPSPDDAPPEPPLRPTGAAGLCASGPPQPDTLPPALAADGATVATRLAGLLYLIHVLADLGLPAVAERGWRLASEAGSWGTLDLLGRGLLAHRFPELAGDPLWRLLAAVTEGPDAAAGAASPGGSTSGGPAGGEPAGHLQARHDPAPRHPLHPGSAHRRPAHRGAAHRGPADPGPTRNDPAWRAPATWAARLDDPLDACRWSAARGRLRLWSAAGWLLADVPRRPEPPSCQARRELARYGLARRDTARTAPPAARRGTLAAVPPLRRAPAAAAPLSPLPPLAPGCPPRLGRWAAAAVPAVRRRLLLALGAGAAGWDPVRGTAGDPVDRLLVLPGTLHLTSSHLDLMLDGEHADVATRRAGLDRDPGWVPALGRVVLFHFL